MRSKTPRMLTGASVVLAILLVAKLGFAGQPVLPDIDLFLVVETQDISSWLVVYGDVLATPPGSTKMVTVSVSGQHSGRRSMNVQRPKFTVQFFGQPSRRSVKIVMTGRVAAAEAFSALLPFQDAVMEIQTGAIENRMTLTYGLSAVAAQLVEMHLTRP